MSRHRSPARIYRHSATPPLCGLGTEYLPPVDPRDGGPGWVLYDAMAACCRRITAWQARLRASFSGDVRHVLVTEDGDLPLEWTWEGTLDLSGVVVPWVRDCADWLFSPPVTEAQLIPAERWLALRNLALTETAANRFTGTLHVDGEPHPFSGTYAVSELEIAWNRAPALSREAGGLFYANLVTRATIDPVFDGDPIDFPECATVSPPADARSMNGGRFSSLLEHAVGGAGQDLTRDDAATLTVRVPNWRFGGTGGMGVPLRYARGYDPSLSAQPESTWTATLQLTLDPAADRDAALPFGLDPLHPLAASTADRVWSPEAQALLGPLDLP